MSDSNLRGTADLSQIRSKSYEHPKTDSELAPATGAKSPVHFAPDVAEHLRPNYNANSRGYSTGNVNTGTPRPKINNRTTSFAIPERPKISSRTTSFAKAVAKRQTMARTLSSASLYSNFAGERYGESRSHSRSTSRAGSLYKDEKRKSMGSNKTEDIKHEESTLGDEMVEDVEEGEAKASVGKAMFMFLKAFIGTGVLFLPKAFENGGLALSIVLMIVISVICCIAFLNLVKTQRIVGGSYGDMGGILYGQFLRFTVLIFIVVSQIGFVCSYFIFIAGNLSNVSDILSQCTSAIPDTHYIWFPLIIIIPFALVRHIAKLSFAAILADLCILFGIICIIYFTAAELKNVGVGPNISMVNPNSFGLMIGTATFSFEGIGLVIPIVESMEKPEKFPLVMIVGMITVTIALVLVGTLSYLAYGSNIQAAVIYNFPSDNKLTISVQLLYALAICLTAPLVLFPALKIIENGIFGKFGSGRDSLRIKWSKNVYRIILCIICAVIAFAIGGDNLDKFVSLVGSIACVPLCFVFPGLFHYKVSKKLSDKLVNIFLVVFGFGIMVYTLYVNINTFVHPGPAAESTAYCAK